MKFLFSKLIFLSPILILLTSIVLILLTLIFYKRIDYITKTITITCLTIILIIIFYLIKHHAYYEGFLFLVNKLSLLFTIFIIILSIITCIFSFIEFKKYKYLHKIEEFYLLILISITGSIVLINSNHMSTLFLGIELMSLPLIGLINYENNNNKYSHSLESTIKYAILSAISASFLLLSIALIYADMGILNFVELTKKPLLFIENNNFNILFLGLLMFVISFGMKMSLVPFHLWNPDVYQGTSFSIISFLTNISKTSIFLVFIKIIILLTPVIHFSKNNNTMIYIFSFLSSLSILTGNIMLIKQNNIKRLMSYSSISQFGYLIFTVIVLFKDKNANFIVLEAAIIYIFSYLLNNICIFSMLKIKNLFNINKLNTIKSSYYVFLKENPFFSICLTIAMLSLAGIPCTLGFVSKFYILNLAINYNMFYMTTIFVIGNIIGIYGYLRFIAKFFIIISNNNIGNECLALQQKRKIFFSMKLCFILMIISTIFTIFFGINPQYLIKSILFYIK